MKKMYDKSTTLRKKLSYQGSQGNENTLTFYIPTFISISLPAAANAFKCFIWNLL